MNFLRRIQDSRKNKWDWFSTCYIRRDSNSFALNLALFVSNSCNGSTKRLKCAGVLLKLLDEDHYLSNWSNLPVSVRSTIKITLLDCLMHEESRCILSNLGKTVMKLVHELIISGNSDGWPELFPCFYQCVISSTSHNYAKIEAFSIFSNLADKIGETMFNSVKDSLHSVLRYTLYDDTRNIDVRVAAMSAAINFILCVSSSNEKERFQDLLPWIMKMLTDAVTSTKGEPYFQKKIPMTYLTKLAKQEPRFLRIQLVDVVHTILDIVEAECLEDEVRHEGIEFLITLVEAKEKAPGMIKKVPLFIGRCFAMLLKLLELDIKDDPAWHSAETWHDQAGTTSTFRVGGEGLTRFSRALGRKSVAHEAIEQLFAYMAAPEWEKRHTALFALSHIAEGCSEVITKNLDEVMSVVPKFFQDPNPRVRCAACRAIAVFFLKFGPHVQEEYHNQLYIKLSGVLDDFHPRVQACAMLALSVICASNKPQALIPHLDGIVNKLLVLLRNEKPMIQQGALQSFTFTAGSVKEHFQTYYDTVLPPLKGVLRIADLKSDLSLRAKAMECIGSIGDAVGKDRFGEDGKQIMEVHMPLQGLQEGR